MILKLQESFLRLVIITIIACLGLFTLISYYHDEQRIKSLESKINERLWQISEQFLNQKLIFIVGVMSSGTTLMRYILDVHPEVNCGDETKIIHLLLKFIQSVFKEKFYVKFMLNSGVRNETIDKATALFIYYMMENNFKNQSLKLSDQVKYLCNKEPENIYNMAYLHRLFPNARFVYMVRDARDVAYSWLTRLNKTIEFKAIYQEMVLWNKMNKIGLRDCKKMGFRYCKLVKYEELVNEPDKVVVDVVKFLNISWTQDFLSHDKHLNKSISVSGIPIIYKMQRKSINNNSVGKWMGRIANYDADLVRKNITMLKVFNYIFK